MNYILWKGISSETIRGLLIAELPSITKPQIRTEITEIEGRDGDIVDKIGYYAYDKEVKIGLMPKCDIDEIIEYFSGKGDLVFSNEFDKIYKAEIIDRIDFERLIRLKKAKVKFHVQPFKYKFGEIPTELDVTTETSLMVKNVGLEQSKPIFTLWGGSGVVEIQINTFGTFQVDFKTDEYLTVNSEIEECYKDTINNLKNRQMTGQFPILNPGENIITWTGNLTKIEVEPKSRWL